MRRAFDTNIREGDGYPKCKDPNMLPNTIHLNNVYRKGEGGAEGDDFLCVWNQKIL